jgi:CrcB protein
MLRHGVGLASLRLLGPGFPYGTLFVNIVGSALMGLAVSLFAAFSVASQDLRLFLTTGIMGGFTTFSTFSLDTAVLWERGGRAAAVYVVASIALSIAALFLTMHMTRRLF